MRVSKACGRSPGPSCFETRRARVRAQKVIVATNAYIDAKLGADGLHRRIVPVASSVVATRPLTDNLVKTVLPARLPVSDSKHLMNYFRLLSNNQLLFGGRGDITGQRSDPGIYRGLEAQLVHIFPQLAGVDIAERWSGMVAVTLDDFPHIGRVEERVLFALGYGGRGVVLAHLMGKYLAAMACGETIDAGPMGNRNFRPIPFHAFHIRA